MRGRRARGSSHGCVAYKGERCEASVCEARMPPRGHRVRREAAPRPYVARAPDDDYHADYGIEYVRAPPDMPGFQVGTKLKVLRRSITEAGCPFGVGLMYLELEHDLIAVFTGKKGIAWMRKG